MAQVGLFKRSGKYKDQNGEEKSFTNFYVRCGDALIPVQVCFFKNDEGKDPQYVGRKEVLKAFAEVLPDLPKKDGETNERGKTHAHSFDDDGDNPF
ncbi:MAG: hypothetical protein ACI4ST_05850 [Candidatus Gallimonas sp.]